MSSAQGLAISFPLQAHLLPTIEGREGPQTSVQLPPKRAEQNPRSPWHPPGSGDTRSLTACSQQGVPGFGLASVPPTLEEMSPAHSLSCNKPQQNHHFPGVPFPRLCGQTRVGSPPIAALLAEESEAAGEPGNSSRASAGRGAAHHGNGNTPRARAAGPEHRGRGAAGAAPLGTAKPLMWRSCTARERHPQPRAGTAPAAASGQREPRSQSGAGEPSERLPVPGSLGAAARTAPAAAAAVTSWGPGGSRSER